MQVLVEIQRIKIAKWIDEYVGRWLLRLIGRLQPRSPHHQNLARIDRILFIKFWGIGSIVLAEPALRHLHRKYPRARIDFLTLKQNHELFQLVPHVDGVHVIEFGHPLCFLLSVVWLIPRLRRQRYDLIFDAEFFANFSALVARLAGPRRAVGFSRPGAAKSRLLDVVVPFLDDQHAAGNFLRLVLSEDQNPPAETDTYKTRPRIVVLPSGAKSVRFTSQPYVVMNVNASPLALERRWPLERFVQLAEWLLQRYEVSLMLIGSRAERKYTQEICNATGSRRSHIVNLAGNLSIPELAALIEHAALFISNDSGPLHLAAALRKPVVGFFGPETPKRFGPLCDDQLVFYLALPCSPCMSVDNAKTVNCTNHLRCMLDLKTEMVISKLRRFMDEREILPRRAIYCQTEESSDLITSS